MANMIFALYLTLDFYKIMLKHLRSLLLVCSGSILLSAQHVQAQAVLASSPYVESFDNIGNGLPGGFQVFTGATTGSLGTAATLTTAATAWNNTSGAFKNFASADALQSSATSANQSASTDRALGVRQTGSLGDPGAAFVFQVTNTINKTGFRLSFDLQSLDISSPRSATWKVQYGIGANPSSFTDAPTITDTSTHASLTTGGSSFFNDSIFVDFGNTLDNVNDVVTIRIVTLAASTGSGNRPSSAIDNFSLSWTDVDTNAPALGITNANSQNISTLNFPTTSIGSPSVQSFFLNGKNLTDDIQLSVSGSNYLLSADSASFTSSVNINAADATNKKIFVEFNPVAGGQLSDVLTAASTGATTINLSLSGTAVDPNITDFEFNACGNNSEPSDGFTEYSVVGDNQKWTCTTYGINNTNGVNMNGYSGGNIANEDWLISPRITKTFNNLPVLSFYSRGEFTGPALQLLVSTDYDGVSNPDNFTWTDLNATFPPLNDTWTLTDGIDLSAYKGAPFYFAFKYVSSPAAGAARWTLDSIKITDQTSLFSVKPLQNNFGAVGVSAHSAGFPIRLQSIGNGDVTVQAPTNFEVSSDSSNYTSSINIASANAEAGTKFYVRFSPVEEKLIINDSLRITSSGGLKNNTVQLSGSSIPKTETFNVAAYNMSFFASSGSSAIVRTPAQITEQIKNIGTVLQHLDADIISFEEMSSDSGLNVLLANVNAATGKKYKGIVSGYWSHKESDDPTYPPQKIGFIYDSSRITLDPSEPPRAIFGDSTNGGYGYTNGGGTYGSSFWSSGRLPFTASFIATVNGKKQKIRMIVIHAKAGGDADSYQRRISDLQVLHDSLADPVYANQNIIILGDFNDRLSTSIDIGNPSSYQVFVNDDNYQKLTYSLDTAGQTSFPGDTGMIDNILFKPAQSTDGTVAMNVVHSGPSPVWGIAATDDDGVVYLDSSTAIEDARQYITDYDKVTGSDHLPISTRFDITEDNSALPVIFAGDITAQLVQKSVIVSWATASEINNEYFAVERSIDGKSFYPIGRVESQGNSIAGNKYNYTDRSPVAGLNYYRIKQVDADGSYAYSNTAFVNVTNVAGNSFQIYPNPVTTKLTLALTNAGDHLQATLYTVSGALVMHTQGTLADVNAGINRQLQTLQSGVYIIGLTDGQKHYTLKFIKQ